MQSVLVLLPAMEMEMDTRYDMGQTEGVAQSIPVCVQSIPVQSGVLRR